MTDLQASLYDIELLQLRAALQSTGTSKSLSAPSVFLGLDPGDVRRDRDFWGHCSAGWLPASALGSSPLMAPALRQRRKESGQLCPVLVRVWEFLCLGEECCYV